MKNAQTFAEQAVKLDPNLAEAYASLAVARQTSWDWPCAEEAYQKALQLKPTLARARRRYAGMMLQWGRFDEAIKQAQMAFEQDPYERSGPASLSMFFFYAGKPREAIDVLAPTVEGQEMPGARFSLGQFYARLGYQTSGAESAEYYRKALAQAKIIADVERRSASLSPSMTAPPSMADQLYALCYSMKGDDRSAEPHLQRLVNEMKLHRLSPVVVAFVYALQRQNAKALDLLEQGATWRDRRLLYIKVNPYFERLRDQPRFRALLSEMRLQ